MKMTFSDLEPIILEKLNSGAEVIIKPNGTSMLPLIHQGVDEVVLIKPSGRLKKYDIPFYKRESGQFVLHRVIKVRKNDYVICGDNQTEPEYGITDNMIIGVVSKIIQNGKIINVDDSEYMKYSREQVRKQRKTYYDRKLRNTIKKLIGRPI